MNRRDFLGLAVIPFAEKGPYPFFRSAPWKRGTAPFLARR